MKRRLAPWALAAATLWGCQEQALVGGGGTDVDGITVEGQVNHGYGRPGAGVVIRVRPPQYLSQTAQPTAPAGLRAWADTRTDGTGHFSVEGLVRGSYVVEVDEDDCGALALAVPDTGDHVDVTATMDYMGTIKGKLSDAGGQPAANALVRVYGLERMTVTDDSGHFTLRFVPAGTYILNATVFYPAASVNVPDVTVRSHGTTTLDSISLPVPYRETPEDGTLEKDMDGSEARAPEWPGRDPGRMTHG